MKKQIHVIVAVISALVITLLFHYHEIGLNLLLVEIPIFVWLLWSKQIKLHNYLQITLFVATLLTGFATVLVYSILSYVVHFMLLFVYVGLLIYPETKSLLTSILLSITNIWKAQLNFFHQLNEVRWGKLKIGRMLRYFIILIIPIFIIFIFIVIYRAANPVFNNYMEDIGIYLDKFWVFITKYIDMSVILTFIFSLAISCFVLIRSNTPMVIEEDKKNSETLHRKRGLPLVMFHNLSLKREYVAAIFLLVVLNGLLLLLNLIDMKSVWFGFEWKGEALKEFVHEGTYYLIFSILISIAIILFYFRKNLNFYPNNRWLKRLSIAWIIQNGFLSITVLIRTIIYIQHFALAYKRIGVIVFLLLTIYGLYTVYIKVKDKKSVFYLLKMNTFAFLMVLSVTALFNWDVIIAKYNFRHYETSFVHLDFMVNLSHKTLPYLDKSIEELNSIDSVQAEKVLFRGDYFMKPDVFVARIENQKIYFKEKWENKSFLSWNLPEYLAYKKLFKKPENNPPLEPNKPHNF